MTERQRISLIHPGEALAVQLDELNLTAAEFAREMHVPANWLYALRAGYVCDGAVS